jgi:hypothetical protein
MIGGKWSWMTILPLRFAMLGLALTAIAAAVTGTEPSKLLIGFTFTHLHAECASDRRSAAGVHRDAGVKAADNVLLNYASDDVRARARQILASMRQEGAEIARTIVWLRLGEPGGRPAGPEVLGLLPAPHGRLAPDLLRNIASYADDVRAAGYRVLVLPISSQIRGTPKCRRLEWGDCFDPDTLPQTWTAVDQIEQTVAKIRTAEFRIILDIAPESCPEPESRQPIHETLATYTRFMVRHFAAAHGDNFIVSCGAGPTAATAERRLHALGNLYQVTGARPLALDIHIYDQKTSDSIRQTLLATEAEARRLGVPFYILETYADNPTLIAAVRELRARGELPSLQMMAAFPLKLLANCQESLSPPFSLAPLRAAKQKL